MTPRGEKLNDNRTDGVFMYGPILLAGLTDSVYFEMDLSKIDTSIYPVGGGGNKFIAVDSSGNKYIQFILKIRMQVSYQK